MLALLTKEEGLFWLTCLSVANAEMNPDYATPLSGVMIIGKIVGNGLVSLSAMAYQRKLLWHINRAPGLSWNGRLRKMPLLHALYLGGNERKEKRASFVALPKTFQCNDMKNKEPHQVSNRFCQKVPCASHLRFAQLHNPPHNISWVCGFWKIWYFIPI